MYVCIKKPKKTTTTIVNKQDNYIQKNIKI